MGRTQRTSGLMGEESDNIGCHGNRRKIFIHPTMIIIIIMCVGAPSGGSLQRSANSSLMCVCAFIDLMCRLATRFGTIMGNVNMYSRSDRCVK